MRIIMGKYHFIIIGAGWRALYYVRIAKAMPDIFCLDAVYCRTQEKADKIAREYQIHTTTSKEECAAYKPDFAVIAVNKAEICNVAVEWMAVCPGPVSTGFGKAARRPGFTGNMMPGRNAFDTSVETVVKDSLRALARGRARVFPGMKIRLAAMLLAAAPLGLIRLFMGRRPRKVLPASNDSPSSAS